MAQNTTEDTKSPVDKTEASEMLMCTTDKVVSCSEEKVEVTDAVTADPAAEEAKKEEEVTKNTNSLDSKEQLDTSETNSSNPKEETNPEEELSSEKTVTVETKENKAEEKCAETKSNSTDEQVNAFSSEAEERLNEILKVVHDELDIKFFQKSVSQSTVSKSSSEDSSDKEQTTKTTVTVEEETEETEETAENAKEDAADTSVPSPEEKKEDDARESSDKTDKKSEVGIVGPPTAVNELLNEEELGGGDSASLTNENDHVAEWVEKSGKVDTLMNVEDEDNIAEEREEYKEEDNDEPETKRKKMNDDSQSISSRKSQKIVTNIIKKSIKCLNRMHAIEGAFGGNGRNVDATANSPGTTTKVPQSQQNGVAVPEETSASPVTLDWSQPKAIVKQPQRGVKMTKKNVSPAGKSQQAAKSRVDKSETTVVVGKKRKSPSAEHSHANGSKVKKVCCLETREKCIRAIVGEEKSVDDLEERVSKLQYEMKLLEKLAQDKEREWNNILRVRKMTEEAYLRLQRKKQMIKIENRSEAQLEDVPPISFDLKLDNIDEVSKEESISKEKLSEIKSDIPEEDVQNESATTKKQSVTKVTSPRQTTSLTKTNSGNIRKANEMLTSDTRQVSEGRQGVRVDVSTIIANHRKKHPEDVPRRGRRMRNTVNVGLVAGGAMVETGHNADSRPSSTDSSPSTNECQNSVNFKEMILQFNKMNQHQGELTKVQQSYPDVTLHPLPSQNTAPQQTGSLLHGILTKAQSPRPTTFSPTLARLLTAPERERNSPSAAAAVAAAAAAAAASMPQQSTATQHLLQTYQGSNLGSISELLSSSKARTEITITPVVNTPAQSHSNNVIHVDDVEEDNATIDDRDSKYSMGRDGRDVRDDRDNPPRCQGCHQRPAQFVCAGCANQWYCSRECQVASWDEHSEICSG